MKYVILLFAILFFFVVQTDAADYGYMHPSLDQLLKWNQSYQTAPKAYIDKSLTIAPTGSLNLLGYLQYTPSQRHQGICGNCWAWAGTGVIEIALNVQRGIKDRLSIQYLDSNLNGGSGTSWACCGGWLDDLTGFYSGTKKAIPWSNANAQYQDGGRSCGSSTAIPGSSISISPNYPISSISTVSIYTINTGKAAAISNIKNALNQGKAIWFCFFLPRSTDWSAFSSFWNSYSESAVTDMSYGAGQAWNGGGGHAVLCVGYDDTDPNNPYWLMLNSWGTTSQRPNGLFRVSMNMNYDSTYLYSSYSLHSFFFQTVEMVYTKPLSITNTVATQIKNNSAIVGGTIEGSGNASVFWGLNDGGTTTSSWANRIDLGKRTGPFTVQLTGLSPQKTYYYRCYANT